MIPRFNFLITNLSNNFEASNNDSKMNGIHSISPQADKISNRNIISFIFGSSAESSHFCEAQGVHVVVLHEQGVRVVLHHPHRHPVRIGVNMVSKRSYFARIFDHPLPQCKCFDLFFVRQLFLFDSNVRFYHRQIDLGGQLECPQVAWLMTSDLCRSPS